MIHCHSLFSHAHILPLLTPKATPLLPFFSTHRFHDERKTKVLFLQERRRRKAQHKRGICVSSSILMSGCFFFFCLRRSVLSKLRGERSSPNHLFHHHSLSRPTHLSSNGNPHLPHSRSSKRSEKKFFLSSSRSSLFPIERDGGGPPYHHQFL